MPLSTDSITFKYNPLNISDYKLYYSSKEYYDDNDYFKKEDNDLPKKEYKNISWSKIKYEKYSGFKTDLVNNLASILITPIDLIYFILLIIFNVIAIVLQIIFHSPVVIYLFFKNILKYLDEYVYNNY